ncbi:MAG: hypothetical protein N2202_06315 [Proteobacteria bacterium]|nr:hypothetical protein [Pseudomonadota bacterium]
MLKFREIMILMIAILLTFGLMFLIQVELPKYMENEIKCFDVYVVKN